MANEPPNDLVETNDRESVGSAAFLDEEIGETASSLPVVGVNKVAGSAADDPLNTGWGQEAQPAEPSLVVVDPFTAAPASVGTPGFGGMADGIDQSWNDRITPDDPFVPLPYSPASQAETIRRSGLAWSAGIAFFGSVAFTLFLGWIVDLLLGISPWGIIGGIVFGSIIGFVQFFRITSRIFPSKDNEPAITPLMSDRDDE